MDDPLRARAADLRDAIRLALRDLDRLADEARAARPRVTPEAQVLEVYGAGAIAHGYYTHLERVFERIVRDLNSAPLEGPDWHRRLLLAMTLDRPGARPALFSAGTADLLDELLRFRHLFRNLYVLDLDPRRIGDVLDRLIAIHTEVSTSLNAFDVFLAGVAARA